MRKMKDYVMEPQDASSYILDIWKDGNGTISVQFADGRIFQKISACEENLQKIAAAQEAQAAKGIDNYVKFHKDETRCRRNTFFSGVGAFALSTGATFIPAVQNALSGQSPLIKVAGIGIITVLGMIPAYAKLTRASDKVQELDKIRYRDAHMSELSQYRDYPNSLSGMNPRTAAWFRSTEDPFSILNIDFYNRSDLEQIVDNIGVEKTYQFTYPRRGSRNQ